MSSINLQCEELRKNIVKQINDSGLPISLVYYMMKDLMGELSEVNSTVLAKEKEDALRVSENKSDEGELSK